MIKHCFIPFEIVVAFHEGHATPAQTGQVRRHLEHGCKECKRRLKWLDQVIPALRRAITEELPAAPAEVLLQAFAIPRERRSEVLPLLVRIARLVFDSRQSQLGLGVRDADSGDQQMLYSTDENDVDLWQEKQGADNWYLIGQVLPKNGGDPITPSEVVLSAQDGTRRVSSPEAEEFMVRDVPAGTYEIRLRLPDHEIVLSDVVVGA